MPPWVTPSRVQVTFPLLEFRPVGAAEGQMVQAGATLVERFRALQVRELVDADERPSRAPDDVVERTGVLVDHWVGAEQPLVPGAAAPEVASP